MKTRSRTLSEGKGRVCGERRSMQPFHEPSQGPRKEGGGGDFGMESKFGQRNQEVSLLPRKKKIRGRRKNSTLTEAEPVL